ncbi:competence protein ComK [Alkalibacillus silvisoli]
MEQRQHYIINDGTMAIKHHDDPTYKSWILENDAKYLCEQNPEEILNASCLKKGLTTLEGRRRAVEDLINKRSRLPIPIEMGYNSLFIPTTLQKRSRSDWVSYRYIQEFYYKGNNDFFSTIQFTTGEEVQFEMTKTNYNKQLMYAGFLLGYFHKKDDIG